MRPVFVLILFTAVLCGRIAPVEGKGASPAASNGAAVVREMNLARQHPEIYARFLEGLRVQFHGNIRFLPGRTMLRTREGVGAVEDAIRFLRQTRPLAPLLLSPGMTMAAAQHVADQAGGRIGHSGSDFSNPGERMNRHGTWHLRWGENISYGKTNARDVVLALIIDDGLRGRKHRKNIFNPDFHYAGAAFGRHARYGKVCSMDFAGAYVENGAAVSRSLLARN